MGQREIISSVNRREAHTPFGGYETFEQAKARDNSQSQVILPLDGLWPFAAYPTAEDVPAGWASPTGEELAALPTMPVPTRTIFLLFKYIAFPSFLSAVLFLLV